ncbi:DUF2252 family protein [Marinomonas ostreistagni]|nr:DUF2252 family protein [Marinomonas ostreistagni]MBM6550896.1 DUF2252 family protein [Marinomonas ostreistagni]
MTRVDGVAPGSDLAKHQKMAQSPFVFLRGSAALFYHDLATARVRLPSELEQWPLTMIMGDCHVSNFGFFSEEGSHGGDVIFAPNDFDDACVGQAGWDLLRFGVSMILSADHCKGALAGTYQLEDTLGKSKVVDSAQVEQALEAFLESYRAVCVRILSQQWDYRAVLQDFEKDHILHKPENKAAKRQAAGKDFMSKSSLAKAVDLTAFPLQFRALPEKFQRINRALYHEIEQQFAPYVDDHILDIVERVGAGTGSVNMARYYLLVGPDAVAHEDELAQYHIVEIKKQRPAAPLFCFTELSPVNLLNPAHLTVTCQRRMQRNPDLVLDEARWKKSHWLIRSRHHARVGIDPEDVCCGKKAQKNGLLDYAYACGMALALAHCRSDRRGYGFEHAVAATPDQAWQALKEVQKAYAEQVKQDWQWLASEQSR